MVAKTDTDTGNGMNLAGWLAPFDYSVWALILATIVMSGFAYMLVQRIDDYKPPGGDDQQASWVEMQYRSAMSFVGQFDLSPTTNAARLMAFSMAFWSVLIMAAYTANFVSFLVVQNAPKLNFESVHDAVAAGVPMCIMATSAMDVAVSSSFQKINLVRVPTEREVFLALQNGDCLIGLSTASAWAEYERDSEINPGCNLRWMGRAFKIQQGHFATFSDSGTLCTNLIRDVINLHMIEMRSDGFIDRVWEKYLESIADMNCNAMSAKKKETESMRLGLNDMMGNFVVHFLGVAVAIVWAIISRNRRRLLRENENVIKAAAAMKKSFTSVRNLAGLSSMEDSDSESSIEEESAHPEGRALMGRSSGRRDYLHRDIQHQLASLVTEVKSLKAGMHIDIPSADVHRDESTTVEMSVLEEGAANESQSAEPLVWT